MVDTTIHRGTVDDAETIADVHARSWQPAYAAWDQGMGRAVLWVLSSNDRARRFYEVAGWRPDGATKVEERAGGSMREVRYWRTLRGGDGARP